jgi:metal-responsive CopG/Arc/MetJ family transcriptional regulator
MATNEKEREKERLQFDFTSEAVARLDNLRELSGVSSRAEVIRNALRVYEWFMTEIQPEDTIHIFNKDKEMVSNFKAKLLR